MATMTRLIPGSSAVLALGVLVTLSACGAEPSGGGASNPPPTSVGAGPPTSSAPKPAAAEQTLFGVIIEGIRPSCRVLQTNQRRYALVGATTQSLRQGQKVSVTGVERADLVNPCGRAFVVTAIKVDAHG
jgi:hypothetical protein